MSICAARDRSPLQFGCRLRPKAWPQSNVDRARVALPHARAAESTMNAGTRCAIANSEISEVRLRLAPRRNVAAEVLTPADRAGRGPVEVGPLPEDEAAVLGTAAAGEDRVDRLDERDHLLSRPLADGRPAASRPPDRARSARGDQPDPREMLSARSARATEAVDTRDDGLTRSDLGIRGVQGFGVGRRRGGP